MVSESTYYRQKMKKEDPERYQLYLLKQKARGAKRRAVFMEEPMTKTKRQIIEARREKDRLYRLRKKAEADLSGRTRAKAIVLPPKPTGKRLVDMTDEELREYNRMSKQIWRANLSAQHKRRIREKDREYARNKRKMKSTLLSESATLTSKMASVKKRKCSRRKKKNNSSPTSEPAPVTSEVASSKPIEAKPLYLYRIHRKTVSKVVNLSPQESRPMESEPTTSSTLEVKLADIKTEFEQEDGNTYCANQASNEHREEERDTSCSHGNNAASSSRMNGTSANGEENELGENYSQTSVTREYESNNHGSRSLTKVPIKMKWDENDFTERARDDLYQSVDSEMETTDTEAEQDARLGNLSNSDSESDDDCGDLTSTSEASIKAQAESEGWVTDLKDYPDQPPFSAKPGLSLPEGVNTPFEIYRHIMNDEVLLHFCTETNRYAKSITDSPQLQHEEGSVLEDWQDVSLTDMKGFFLLLHFMGILRKPRIEDYWSQDWIMYTSFPFRIMTQKRFEAIFYMFHIANNDFYLPESHPAHDPLFKVRYFYDYLKEVFPRLYTPEQDVVLDRLLCPWQGHLYFRAHTKGRRPLWGIRLHMLTESKSFYLHNFEVDTRGIGLSNKPKDVCYRLLGPLVNQGYRLTLEHLYFSPSLCQSLADKNTPATVAFVGKRKCLPKDLMKENVKGKKFAYRRKGSVVALKWKKRVHFLTTAQSSSNIANVKTDKGCMEMEKVLDAYDEMLSGGVRGDMILEHMPLEVSKVKWWKRLFLYLHTLTKLQCSILYSKLQESKGQKTRRSSWFCMQLITGLEWEYFQAKALEDDPFMIKARLTGQHFPGKLPKVAKDFHFSKNCIVCERKDSAQPHRKARKPTKSDPLLYCETCCVALCVKRGCYKIFHTVKDYWLDDSDDYDNSESDLDLTESDDSSDFFGNNGSDDGEDDDDTEDD